jgi:hypothetical protein
VKKSRIFKQEFKQTPAKKFVVTDLEDEMLPEPPKPILMVPSDFTDFAQKGQK